ncbi:MFS transporter [Terribacillus saccharophilus]|uniref:MFS transporter n=1 Tax=Terribacillus saccharophilus TaxID=361277 RepID=A0ABX4H2X6_9BACI|nr:MFS transporter [Terribacillus saccharophilus]PAD37117.1 MFS transporter [Terribacillus saccharophilus]PAD97406.1 MFS transporter [Terribacillus saccharophilus]PAE01454.1 MFS transporter [Terribacillus saccharophilus]
MNNTWKIYMLMIISFFIGTSQFGIVGMLDKISDSVGVSVATAGQLITVFALGNAIGTPIVMIAISKLNQQKQLLLALSVVVIGIIFTLVLPGFALLMVARVILGIGTGMFIVTAYDIAAKLASPGKQGAAMANIAMGFSSSLVFGVPIGRIISASYDWKAIFWIIGVFSVIALIVVAKTIPAFEGGSSISLSKRLSLLKNPRVALTLSITFFVFLGFSVVDTYITPYLNAITSTGTSISAILFAMGIASVIGSKSGGLLADRIGVNRTLIGSMVIQAVALALLSVGSEWVVSAVVLLMLWEVACWMFGSTQNFNLVSLVPEASSIVLSLNSSSVQLGFAAGAAVGGIIVGGTSIMSITWISATSALLAAIIAISLSRLKKN